MRTPDSLWGATAAIGLALAACGANPAADDGGAGLATAGNLFGSGATSDASGDAGKPGAPCTTDKDCGPGGVCDPGTHTCGCGGTVVTATNVPPNLLVVQDRSCSMTAKVGGMPKWTVAVGAIENLTMVFNGRIRFGLELFPERSAVDKCSVTTIDIPVSPGNEAKIQQLLTSALQPTDPNYPSGPCVTPIDSAMQRAETEPSFNDATRVSYALLITDGMQAGCRAGGGDPATLQALTAMFNKGVHTFVVGFGAAVSVTSLDSFAIAGGEVNPAGPHKFYQAQDAASLQVVLSSIATHALSCTLALSQAPPNGDVSRIFVYFDKTPPPIARDPNHVDGWDYDPMKNEVQFFGPTCDKLKTRAVTNTTVVFGCVSGGPPPPPPH